MLVKICDSLSVGVHEVKTILIKANVIHIYTPFETLTVETPSYEKACEIAEDVRTGINQVRQAELSLKLSGK